MSDDPPNIEKAKEIGVEKIVKGIAAVAFLGEDGAKILEDEK